MSAHAQTAECLAPSFNIEINTPSYNICSLISKMDTLSVALGCRINPIITQFIEHSTGLPVPIMFSISDDRYYNSTTVQHRVTTDARDINVELKTALAVEMPLVTLALSTVLLRLYSRLAIKKNLAPDDILVILGTVRSEHF